MNIATMMARQTAHESYAIHYRKSAERAQKFDAVCAANFREQATKHETRATNIAHMDRQPSNGRAPTMGRINTPIFDGRIDAKATNEIHECNATQPHISARLLRLAAPIASSAVAHGARM